MRKTIIALAAATVVLGTAGSAMAAQPDDPATACKSGGYVGYVDPATGQPFANQGACVSLVRHGGTLVPVVPPPPPVTATVTNSFGAPLGSQCTWNVQLTGFPPNTVVPVVLTFRTYTGTYDETTDATGSVLFTAGINPIYGEPVTASTSLASDTDIVRC